MSARLDIDDDGTRRLAGVLDFESVPALYRRTREVLARGERGEAVTLDLSAVESANGAGVALLLEWRRQAHRNGGRLVLSGLPEPVLRVARLSGVEALLTDATDPADPAAV